jgi:glycosyltransferase involved in cell wall biosynthesis
MKILHIASILPSSRNPDANKYVVSIINGTFNILQSAKCYILHPAGYKLNAIKGYICEKVECKVELEESRKYINVKILKYLSVGRSALLHSWFSYIFMRPARIPHEVLQGAEITHAHYIYPDGCLSYNIYMKYNIPYVLTLQNEKRFLRNKLLQEFAKQILINASAIATHSPAMANVVSNIYNKDVWIIPLGVHEDFFIMNTDRDVDRAGFRILTVARLLKIKNIDKSIMAFAKFIKSYSSSAIYTIIGDGPEYDFLRKLAEKHDLCSNIEFMGNKSKDSIIEVMQKSDVFLLNSRKESYGQSVAEALSCGLPTIVTKYSGIWEIFGEGSGMTQVDPSSVEDIYLNIVALYSDKALRDKLSKEALVVRKNFSWKSASEKYVDLYCQAVT